MKVLVPAFLSASSKAVCGAGSSAPASAQHPERTEVREECEHCPVPKWQVSQASKR